MSSNEPNLKQAYDEIRTRLRSRIVGMDDVIKLLVTSIFSGGHCLLIGVPGLAKTRLISSVAQLLEMDFSRIQFTPDLMPSDITGAEIIFEDKESGERQFRFHRGPIFANIVLADEINRTPPKTQAALMEAMEEGQVSSLGQRFTLDPPFFVLATQNPIEQEGTYPLPAAQLDRFFFNIDVGYPSSDEEADIIRMTTRPHDEDMSPVLSRQQVLDIVAEVRRRPIDKAVAEYATKLARLSRPDDPEAPEAIKRYVSFGAGPRAAQALVQGAKIVAALRGDLQPKHADVRDLVLPVFRHRVVLNFMAAAEGIDIGGVLEKLVAAVPAPDMPVVREKKRGLFAFLQRS